MNKELLSRCGLDKWHAAGYTGKGIRVAVYDDIPYMMQEMTAYASIPDIPLPRKSAFDTHCARVARCLHEAAPQAEIFLLSAMYSAKEAAQWIADNNIDLISCSYVNITASLSESRRILRDSGIIMLAAAGNETGEVLYPAAYDWTIAVGAARENGESRASYSNTGTELDCLAYIPQIHTASYPDGVRLEGTSFAQPFVAGMIACYMQYCREHDLPHGRAAVKAFIAANCRDIYTAGKDADSGNGLFIMPDLMGKGGDVILKYQYPFKSKFVFGTPYGQKGDLWKCGWHSGLDLKSANYGGDGRVYPIAAGTVQRVTINASYGKHIYIAHPDGYISLYAHLASIKVTQGQTVTPDTMLGIEGATGNATGKHLHLEIHKGAYKYPASIDPREFIEKRIREEETPPQFVKTITKIKVNGVVREVQTIQYEGHNYIKLRDLTDGKIAVDYDVNANLPILEVK